MFLNAADWNASPVMATMYDVPAEALIEALAEDLEDRLDPPEWSRFTKSGSGRELPPEQENFWSIRAASVLRKVADASDTVGVGTLASAYGSSQEGTNRYGVAPGRHTDGSRNIIRTILQQLEEEGLVETAEGQGRRITPDGQQLLDDTAGDVLDDLDRPELERYA